MKRVDRLREIGVAVAEELAAGDAVRAVMVVGSTATGHADEHSDVDLRVVGSVDAGERSVDGVHVEWTPVTVAEVEAKLDDWEDDSALYTYAHAELAYDRIGLGDVLANYDSYPPSVRREKLYAGWFYGTGNAFDARKAGQRGDDRAKRCAAASAVEQFAALTYVLDGRFPPYRKWLFHNLPTALRGIDAALTGDGRALRAIVDELEPKLREHLSDDRIDNPYLHRPRYDALG